VTDTKRDESRDDLIPLYVLPNEFACAIKFRVGRVYGEFEKPDVPSIEYVPHSHLLAETDRADMAEQAAARLAQGIEAVAGYLGQGPSKVSILAALNTLEGLLR
jgi:hypothetical protein